MSIDKKQIIRFSKNNTEFIQELRGKVKDYFITTRRSKYGNASLLFKAFFMASLYFVPYLFMITGLISSFSGILFSYIAMGFGMAGIGMGIMHDANHGSASSNKSLNRFLGKSLYILGGFPPNWRYQHNTLHHGYTNIDGFDEDIDQDGLFRFTPHQDWKKHHKYQHLYALPLYSLMTIDWVTVKDFTGLFRYKKENAPLSNKSKNQLLSDLIITKIIYFGLFLVMPLVYLPIPWYWTIILFIIMHMICSIILSVIFQTAHVMPTSDFPKPDLNGNIDHNWAIHQLLTTTDYAPKNRIFSWFIGGLNYQIEHHLFPNVSHVHYRKISPMVKKLAMKYNIPYHVQPSFLFALKNHLVMLKYLGRPPLTAPSTKQYS